MSTFDPELWASVLPSTESMLQSRKLSLNPLSQKYPLCYQCVWAGFQKQEDKYTLYLAIKHAVKKDSELSSMTKSTRLKILLYRRSSEIRALTHSGLSEDVTVSECKRVKMAEDENTAIGILKFDFNDDDPYFDEFREFLELENVQDIPLIVIVQKKPDPPARPMPYRCQGDLLY